MLLFKHFIVIVLTYIFRTFLAVIATSSRLAVWQTFEVKAILFPLILVFRGLANIFNKTLYCKFLLYLFHRLRNKNLAAALYPCLVFCSLAKVLHRVVESYLHAFFS